MAEHGKAVDIDTRQRDASMTPRLGCPGLDVVDGAGTMTITAAVVGIH